MNHLSKTKNMSRKTSHTRKKIKIQRKDQKTQQIRINESPRDELIDQWVLQT